MSGFRVKKLPQTCRLFALCVYFAVFCASCGSQPAYRDDPCDVVREYLVSVEVGDIDSVWTFLSDTTREQLDSRAAAYNEMPQHGTMRTGREMLRTGHVLASTREYKKLVLASRTAESADVDIVLHDDSALRITLKNENGRWAVMLPL